MIADSGCYVDMWARGVGLHVSSYETHLMKLKIVIQKRTVISSFFCFGLTSLRMKPAYFNINVFTSERHAYTYSSFL